MAEAARIVSIATLQYRVPVVAAALTLLAVGPGVNSTAFAQQAPQYTQQAQQPQQPQQQQFNVQQISQLVAPIALYPDNLLGQILAASTYPLEIVVAARWSSSNQNVSGQALEDAMQLQSWDPSVKALTAVPQVLQMMSEKLEWTQQLGAAYLGQPDDIAAAVQRLRARADASGNLKETKQIKVRREAAPPPPPAYAGEPLPPEYIIIEPYEPDYLYVPIYDPWVVYGVWPYPAWRPFYWYPPRYVAVGIIGFGAPCLVGAAIWANYSWRSRSVIVDVHKFDKFHHTKLASLGGGTQAWKYKSATFSGPKVGSGPKTFTSTGKPPGSNGFNASGPGNNGPKPDHQRHTTFNPSNGGNSGKPPGLVSNNQSGQGTNSGSSRTRTYNNGNGPPKNNVQRLTNNQTFRSSPNFKLPPKPAPRVQHYNKKP
jgi:Protein of unknown function (DUF3300)